MYLLTLHVRLVQSISSRFLVEDLIKHPLHSMLPSDKVKVANCTLSLGTCGVFHSVKCGLLLVIVV